MTFKEGNKVIIVKAFRENGRYYHGGNTSYVPLKSKGKVIEVYDVGKIRVRLDDGSDWNLHPSEIRLNERTLKSYKLPRFPESYVFKVASQTPVFLLNDRMYILDRAEKDTNSNFFQTKESGRTVRQRLVESASLTSLEELTYQHNLKWFNEVEKQYFQAVIEEREEQTKDKNERYKLLDFIINEVFPHFKGDGTGGVKLEKLLGVKSNARTKKLTTKKSTAKKRSKQKVSGLEMFISKLMEKIEKEKFQEAEKEKKTIIKLDSLLGYDPNISGVDISKSKDYKPLSLLGKVLSGKNVAIIGGVVYNLIQVDSPQKKTLNFNKKNFVLVSPKPISNIKNKYDFELSKKLRIETLRTKLAKNKKIQELELKDARLKNLLRRKEYREGDFGFIRKDRGYNSYYVFLKVPKHVLKMPREELECLYEEYDEYWDRKPPENGRFYFFKSVRVALEVFLDSGEISFNGPVTVESYDHPFSSDTEEYGSICLGGYQFSKLDSLKRGEAVAKLLVDTKNTLLSGYTAEANPERSLSEYDKNRIYPSAIKKRNLQVTNAKLASRGKKR